jgi:hypothetical protein
MRAWRRDYGLQSKIAGLLNVLLIFGSHNKGALLHFDHGHQPVLLMDLWVPGVRISLDYRAADIFALP